MTHTVESAYTFIFKRPNETVYGSFEPCSSIQHLRLEPDFSKIERVFEYFGGHARNLCTCYDRPKHCYVSTYTPKGDVFGRIYCRRDGKWVVTHDSTWGRRCAGGNGKGEAGVLLHYLRPGTTNPVDSCMACKIEWKTRTRDSDQPICSADRTSEIASEIRLIKSLNSLLSAGK